MTPLREAPATEAGRALLNGGPPTFDELRSAVLAIEAEALPLSIDVEALAEAWRRHDRNYQAAWNGGDKEWTWERKAADLAREYVFAAGSKTPVRCSDG